MAREQARSGGLRHRIAGAEDRRIGIITLTTDQPQQPQTHHEETHTSADGLSAVRADCTRVALATVG